ncbi:DUF1003 domain-containing protein [Glacieibacterium sp.]|uniref:DUF1003 domain-containing protein n=1 Tax=Glacieibacterium sp. TaxID=2860237 RepID=UPI003AFFABA7
MREAARNEPGDPGHVNETVEHLAQMHRELDEATPGIQKVANSVTHFLGRPGLVAAILALVAVWIVGNAIAQHFGYRPIDIFPFPELALVATVSAFLLAMIILSTQRYEDERATKRSQLTLQIAVLSEKKIAKIIALLEEARRESPNLSSRVDREADAMAQAADPRSNLQQIEAAENAGDAASRYRAWGG